MTLTELRYIVAVARHRHFGHAAEACHVSQPTLSMGVRRLEEQLGVQLFERGHGEVRITEVGEEIVAQAQRVLDEAERIPLIAGRHADPLDGPLRLGAIYTIGPYLLPWLVPLLRERAPHMPLLIEEDYTAGLARRLRSGELDAILVALPFDEPGIDTRPLYEEPFVALLPSGHPLAACEVVTLAELAEEDLLLLGPGHCFRDQLLAACPACRERAESWAARGLEGSSLETIRHMVASGLGVTVLPCTAAGDAQGPGRVTRVRRLQGPVPQRRVALAWRSGFPRRAAIETLCKAIAEVPLSCIRKLASDS